MDHQQFRLSMRELWCGIQSTYLAGHDRAPRHVEKTGQMPKLWANDMGNPGTHRKWLLTNLPAMPF
jgi:hypothetical protein